MAKLNDLLASHDAILAVVDGRLPVSSAARFHHLLLRLRDELGAGQDADVWLASAPGRTELAGNHTDHNRGRVLAASVQLDSIAAVVPRDDGVVQFASAGFPLVQVDLSSTDPRERERESTAALVRGVAAGFRAAGHRIGGFNATVGSTVLPGSGLSSSASIEVLLGAIFSSLYNGGAVSSTEIAKIGQYAENSYFGKPSGLMDQLACATGGAIAIDFADLAAPNIDRVEVSFEDAGLALLVVETGGTHADLTDEYAAIPRDMRTIASALGGEVLRDIDAEAFFAAVPRLRREIGDRPVSRAIHFFQENVRVEQMVDALRNGDMGEYLSLMAESGRSSGLYLQNCVPAGSPEQQGIVVALALTERFFAREGLRTGRTAACRVHGGGFAGTIQVLLPRDRVDRYATFVSSYLGEEAVTSISIRKTGATALHG
ncbi:MAG: galactokinase [Spirochaetota bacterium]